MKDLATELDQEIERRAGYARTDFIVAQIVLWAAIIGSAATTITVAKGWLSGTVLGAVVAALPAIVLLIDSRMHYEARHQWNARYKVELDILRRQLREKRREPAEVSESFDALDVKMENEFPYSGGAKARVPVAQDGAEGGNPGAARRRPGAAKKRAKSNTQEIPLRVDVEGGGDEEELDGEGAEAKLKKG